MFIPEPFMIVVETARLNISHLSHDDVPFILELVNDPAFIANIGDRQVRSLADARRYIDGPLDSYARHGFGLFRTALRDGDIPIGICGLLRRDTLPDVDIGFAYLPRFRGQGYGSEAARAVMDYGRAVHGLTRIIGVVSPTNAASIRILEKLGMRFERAIDMPGYDGETWLYAPEP